MKLLAPSTLVDALTQWGQHEAEGRFKEHLAFSPEGDKHYLNILLYTRPLMVAHLLNKKPSQCLQVEMEPGDDAALRLSNGQTLDEWITQTQAGDKPDSWAHYLQLVAAEAPPAGPVLIVGALTAEPVLPDQPVNIGGLMVYDGWHRMAAWLTRCRQQRPSNLLANLVITPTQS